MAFIINRYDSRQYYLVTAENVHTHLLNVNINSILVIVVSNYRKNTMNEMYNKFATN
jgi:hypothetical protein